MKALLILSLSLVACVKAHMHLEYPPSLNAANHPFTEGAGDQHPDYPYNCCGMKHEYPCKGYLNLLDTPAGRPVATWEAGSTQHWNMSGKSNHYGGSCQIGFSVDKGKTFRVIRSYEGNCPHRNDGDGQDFDFQVPSDLPAGNALFAWSWVNREQELNMNSASINIAGDAGGESPPPQQSDSSSDSAPQPTAAQPTAAEPIASEAPALQGPEGPPIPVPSPTSESSATPDYVMDGCTCNCVGTSDTSDGGTLLKECYCYCSEMPVEVAREPRRRGKRTKKFGFKKSAQKRAETSVAFGSRPVMLAVDIGNGCTSPRETAELKYPNPGPDVVRGDGEYPLELPVGNCG